MKNNHLILALAVIAGALLSCAREQVDAPETITIRAFQEGAAETRTTLIDGGTQVYWEPADELKLFFRGAGSRFLSQNTEVADIAEFSGSLNVVVGVNEGASGSNTLWGLYPYRADATSDGASVTTTLPTAQTGRADSFAKGTFITLAKSTSFDLAFYNVCGGIRFSLTTEGVKEVVFQGQNDEDIAGKVKLAFVDGVPAVQEVLEGQKTITLTAPGGGTFETGKWYYIVALPGTLSNGFKMTFNTETQYATLKSSGSKTIKRGIFGSLADADEDLIFKDKEGGDIPNPEDVIQFEDPIAKYACVEKFDTNKDGEVSYAEAAAVTSLEGLFTDWNTVTSFDEIRYFTSVTSTENVFTGLTKLTHITIPDYITKLGTFQNCTALVKVVIPANLSSLPNSCFAKCASLTSVALPSKITQIPDDCFMNCIALDSVVIPPTVTSIGWNAFMGCSAISSIDLPSGLETLFGGSFYGCYSLSSIDLPTSLRHIGSSAFSYCTALNSIFLASGIEIEDHVFSGCSSLLSVVLPEDLTAIPAYCFSGCERLTTIIWPNSLASIGEGAFFRCMFENNDFSLQLPSTVTTIENRAFDHLRHLVLPSTSPITISANSFESNYTILYVPANMVEMYKLRTTWTNYADRIMPLGDFPLEWNMGEAIDLGLSVKWASFNVDASRPEEFGGFFQWGGLWGGENRERYPYFSWYMYPWCNNSDIEITKYNTKSINGFVDNKDTLDLEDDAAHYYWGGTWRMPTRTEFEELVKNCDAVWTIENGVKGKRFTSKIEGFTDKSVFSLLRVTTLQVITGKMDPEVSIGLLRLIQMSLQMLSL